jgi:CRP-like cAMP-binding protein
MLQPAHPGPLDVSYPGDIIFLPRAEQFSGFAATTAEVWRVRCHDLAAAQSRDIALAEFVIRQLSAQRQRAQLRRAIVSELPIDERVAALLIEFASRVGVVSNQGITFDMPLSRSEVANLLGLNADTLSRIMSRFTAEGLIARSSRTHITVKASDRLRSMCRFSAAIMEQAAF